MIDAFAWFETHAAFAIGVALATAAALAIARVLHRQWRADAAGRSRAWRVALLVLAQPLCAALLYLALVPPGRPGEPGVLVVATAGTTDAQWAAVAGETHVALPEAPALAGAERVPDLATALRRYPATVRVRVVGGGLPARDRGAAHGIAIAFDAPAWPRGVVEFETPAQVAAGGVLRVTGRVHGVPGGEVELVDPASQRVDRVALNDDGRFELTGTARVPGAATFGLRLRDAEKRLVESADVPVAVDAQASPRVLLLAGASSAELKFLRRWAGDAGLPVHTRIDLGAGLHAGDAPVALDRASLARFDLAVLDERAWSSLGDAQRAALVAAVRDGLGLLLRVTATPTPAERQRLRALGFSIEGGRDVATVRLAESGAGTEAIRARIGPGTEDAPLARDADVPALPALMRRALRIAADDGVTLLADADGTPFAVWRAEGRGRVAVWSLVDSHRLVLAGRGDLHAELWSTAATTLARTLPRRSIGIEGAGRPGERIALCGLAADARVLAPDGRVASPRVDPATGARACAAYFPRLAGWHRVETGGIPRLFHVRAQALPGVDARERREATLRLVVDAPAAPEEPAIAVAAASRPGERWPWWLAWLAASAALWWFERSRAGRVA